MLGDFLGRGRRAMRIQLGDPLTPEDVYAKGMSVRLPAWQKWARPAKEQWDQMMLTDAA